MAQSMPMKAFVFIVVPRQKWIMFLKSKALYKDEYTYIVQNKSKFNNSY